MSLAGSAGSKAKSTLPTSFSYAPAAPKAWPPATTSRRSIRRRRTAAWAVCALIIRIARAATTSFCIRRLRRTQRPRRTQSCILRTSWLHGGAAVGRLGTCLGIGDVPARLVDQARDLLHLRVVDLL